TNEGQVAEYLPTLERLAQQGDAKPELQLLVARGLLAKQNAAGAVRYLTLVYAKQPKLLEGNRDFLLALSTAKQYPMVVALAPSVLALNPDDRDVRLAQIDALTATG